MIARFASLVKHSKIYIFLVTMLLVLILSTGCTKETSANLVMTNLNDYSFYSEVAEQSARQLFNILDKGFTAEAFDTQAAGALKTGIANYWYPHYLATVIIAVDRGQTDAVITSWNDLLTTQEEVAFFSSSKNSQMLMAAISYGLEGEDYSLKKAVSLLAALNDSGRLKINSVDSPIIICYDYQAVNLAVNGRSIDIIIPKEGTLTYEKGLLSKEILNFEGNLDKLLFDAKLRLLNGESDPSIYPDKKAYLPAVKVVDYEHFAKTTQNVNRLIEREVLNSKRYMSVDNREHLFTALISIIIVTIWSLSIIRRSRQKAIGYTAFLTGILLNSWILVRLIKYQIVEVPILTRYLWYSFYIFQLLLPLVMLWMAWAIDKSEEEIFPPKWWRYLGIFLVILILFVFTNDLHGLVFHLDLSKADWDINYSYGFGYYVVLFVCMTILAAVLVILAIKSIRNPRKKAFIFPFAVFLMFALYTYQYIMRHPLAYETDITIVTGLFTILLFEACISSGMIPVNSKYIEFFTHSPLKMLIVDNGNEVVLASAAAEPIKRGIREKVITALPEPIIQEDFSILSASIIPGGYVIWHEDVSKLYLLNKEIQKTTQMLLSANALLVEEEKIKRIFNEENEKKLLMEQLDVEIVESIKQLSTMIEELPQSADYLKENRRIALLLCYIKRRCNLFFLEQEVRSIAADELIVYIDELAEIARYSNVQIATIDEIRGRISVRNATLVYDFFNLVTDLAIQTDCPYIIVYLEIADGFLTMRFLPSKDIGTINLNSQLRAAIISAKGKIVKKNLEDTIGISIYFPEGGEEHD